MAAPRSPSATAGLARARRRRRVSFWLVLAALAVSITEGASWFVCRTLQDKWCMFSVPAEVDGHLPYDEYLARRDPLLGWPYPEELGGKTFDRSGARPSPAFPDPSQPARISVYGDSFAQSQCSDTEAWSNQLAVRLNMRVANYGVGGYGTDQAMLRFERNVDDPAEVVILSHLSENVLRNLSRNRDLLTHTRHYAYKPRFALGPAGELQRLAMPQLSLEEHLRFIGAAGPRLELPGENFQPGGPAGDVAPAFPFTWSIVRNLGCFRMRARLSGIAEWIEFYEPDHPLRGLQVTAAICREFVRLARARGKTPILLVLPGEPDLAWFRKTGRLPYEPLLAALRSDGTQCFEFGATLLEHIGTRALGGMFDATMHYRPEADALLADFVRGILADLGVPK